jgi:hypothetical protein
MPITGSARGISGTRAFRRSGRLPGEPLERNSKVGYAPPRARLNLGLYDFHLADQAIA